MHRSLFAAYLLGNMALAAPAMAQARRGEGPLLLPPPGIADEHRPNGVQRANDRRTFGDAPSYSPDMSEFADRRESRFGPLPSDPQIRRIAIWYRTLFERDLSASEQRNWQVYLTNGRHTIDDALPLLLGSQEFFKQSGSQYESWLRQVGAAIGRPVTERELQRWRDDRVIFTRRFLATQGNVTIQDESIRVTGFRPTAPAPEDAGQFGNTRPRRGYGEGGYYQNQSEHLPDPWHLSPFSPYEGGPGSLPPAYGHGFHDHHEWDSGYQPWSSWESHEHGHHDHAAGRPPVAGRPAPQSEAELIASWYQTYFGRPIVQWELNKWLSDLEKGMPLAEVYASVLASDGWIERNGDDPRQWIAGTLAALGQRNPAAVEQWYDRFREMDRDHLALTKAMVRRFGIPGRAVRGPIDRDHEHVRDDHDRDRREERRERRRDRDD